MILNRLKKFITFLLIIISHFVLFSQAIDEVPIDLNYGDKPKYNHQDSIQIDSFNQLLANFVNIENKIISIISDNNENRNPKNYLLKNYLKTITIAHYTRMALLVNKIKNDYFLFPTNVNVSGEQKSFNLINPLFKSHLVSFLINNNEFYNCDFFDLLYINNDCRFKNQDIKTIEQIKIEDKNKNIFYVANLLKDHELDLRKVVADEYANDCYRKNAKLLLEALDKNK